MDDRHRFHTADSWWLVRAEHLGLVALLVVLVAAHLSEVRWGRFVFAFAVIDVVGYIPGAIAFRKAQSGRIAPAFHHLYNVTHNYLVAGVALGLWAYAAGGPEWAMAAVPIHLSGDRGVFGNTYKPVALPFEPWGATSEEALQNV